MKRKAHVIAYWLMPAEPAREFFAKTIRRLAAQFGAPIFEPHVTIFLATENSRAAVEVLREIGLFDIELTARGIRFGEEFTKTLFVRFEKSDALQKLGDAIWKRSGAADRYLIDPHLSLLYARLTPEVKRTLADTVHLPLAKIRFDEIRAMRCASPTQSADDVRDWKRSG